MKKYAYIAWLLVVIWMIVIFSFSANTADVSSSKSRKVIHTVVDVVDKNKSEDEKERIVDEVHVPVRKMAHAFEYCVLCILLIIAFKSSNIKGKKIYIISLIICLLYAMGDEYHQTFISGRSGELRDCLIDFTGASIGCLIYHLISRKKKK